MTAPPAARTASVLANLRCNQACTWCSRRAPKDDPAFVRGEAVRARIEAGVVRRARDVVLTGGEPAMRVDLADLVAYARARGAERITLETNATLIDGARARALKDAGLDVARVNLPAVGDALDEMTRDPGGFERARAGAVALAEAGVAIEIAAVVVRSTEGHVPRLPGPLRALLGEALRAIVVAFSVDPARGDEALSFERAARVVLDLERAARQSAVDVRMSVADPLPPCAFAPIDRSRVVHLYAMTPGAPARPAHSHLAACAACNLRDRCPGVADAYVARFGDPAMHPVTDERTRRRLAVVSSVDEQIARELVTRSIAPKPEGPLLDEVVRVLFRCNQACTFCFVSTHLPSAPRDDVEAAIRAAGARGSRIVLSGGEPTLDPRIADWVRLAKSVSHRDVVLQTNAVRLDDKTLVDALAQAGLDEAFVSLHGATPETSDAVTRAPETFARTTAGIDRLHATRVRVICNFVVCERNRAELPAMVRLVASRWPRASVNVSFVAPSTDVVPRDRGVVPRYSDALPSIAEAVAEGSRLGVRVHGFESMCGLPLCLVPPGAESVALDQVPEGFDGGEFIKTDECRSCAVEARCWGLRRGYAEIHGTSELRAVVDAARQGRGEAEAPA